MTNPRKMQKIIVIISMRIMETLIFSKIPAKSHENRKSCDSYDSNDPGFESFMFKLYG